MGDHDKQEASLLNRDEAKRSLASAKDMARRRQNVNRTRDEMERRRAERARQAEAVDVPDVAIGDLPPADDELRAHVETAIHLHNREASS